MLSETNEFNKFEVLIAGINKWQFRINKKISETEKETENGGAEKIFTIRSYLLNYVFSGTKEEAIDWVTEKYEDLIEQYIAEEVRNEEITALKEELKDKQEWLNAHDYIGTKIATQRATVEDYHDEIETMKVYAARIDEIKRILANE